MKWLKIDHTAPSDSTAALVGGRPSLHKKLSDAEKDALLVTQVVSEVHTKWAVWIGAAMAVFSMTAAAFSTYFLFSGLKSIDYEVENRRIDRSYDFILLSFDDPIASASEEVNNIIDIAGGVDGTPEQFYNRVKKNDAAFQAISNLFQYYHTIGDCVAKERCDANIIRSGITLGAKSLVERACILIIEAQEAEKLENQTNESNFMVDFIDLIHADCKSQL